MARFILLVVLLLVGIGFVTQYDGGPPTEERRDLYLQQLRSDDTVPQQIRANYSHRNSAVAGASVLWVALAAGLYSREIRARFARGSAPVPTRSAEVV